MKKELDLQFEEERGLKLESKVIIENNDQIEKAFGNHVPRSIQKQLV